MPESFQQEVMGRCVLRKFKTGAWVFRPGDPPGGMYGLVSGSLAVDISPAGRGPDLSNFLRPGAWFGEVPAFTGMPRLAGLRATRATEALYLPLHAINAIAARDSSAWRYFALITMAHIEALSIAVDDLLRRNHTKRLIAMLLHMSDCRLVTPSDPDPIEMDVGQKELAMLANVARTSAGDILRQLARAGHIDLSYRRIRILSPDALRSMLVRSGPATKSRRLLKPNLRLVDLSAKSKRPSVEIGKRHRLA
jgi:CRP/FNR family cyclic AMP-dependent transcriptional regulator